jgi:hypothetical protein
MLSGNPKGFHPSQGFCLPVYFSLTRRTHCHHDDDGMVATTTTTSAAVAPVQGAEEPVTVTTVN